MKIDTHPDTETIIDFLDNPDSPDFQDLELHLTACSDCRKQLSRLSLLQKEIQSPEFIQQQLLHSLKTPKPPVLENALAEGKIESYLEQQLDKDEQQHIAQLLKDQPQALKAALHYASHQSAMTRELSEPVASKAKQTTRLDFIGLIKKFFTVPTPAWVMVPATGFASVLIVFLFSMNTLLLKQDNTVAIASYQDNAVIQYSSKNTQPGIGFFSNAFKQVKPFKNITIEMLDTSTLKFSWPKIENASSYSMRLQKIDNGQNIIIGEQSASSNVIEFKNIKLETHRRYQWILTGETTTNQTFYSSGGFVSN